METEALVRLAISFLLVAVSGSCAVMRKWDAGIFFLLLAAMICPEFWLK